MGLQNFFVNTAKWQVASTVRLKLFGCSNQTLFFDPNFVALTKFFFLFRLLDVFIAIKTQRCRMFLGYTNVD